MNDCVFCKIVKGEVFSDKVYEDGRFIAFLDIEQETKGKMLVVPKEHFRWTYDVPYFGDYFEVAKKVGMAAKEALGADWMTFKTWGLDVEHAHIHVAPRYGKNSAPVKLTEKEKKDVVEKISAELK